MPERTCCPGTEKDIEGKPVNLAFSSQASISTVRGSRTAVGVSVLVSVHTPRENEADFNRHQGQRCRHRGKLGIGT